MTNLGQEVLNSFATAFADRVAERAAGLDDDSGRLRCARPVDHVLTGFLTPPELDDVGDGELADLPKDSPYEQTSIGLDWLCNKSKTQEDAMIDVMARASAYVRVLPSFDEARLGIAWQTIHPPGGESHPNARRTEPAPIWTRLTLPPLRWRIPIHDVLRQRRLRLALADIVQAWWSETFLSIPNRFPGRQRLWITEQELSSEAAYDTWRLGVGTERTRGVSVAP